MYNLNGVTVSTVCLIEGIMLTESKIRYSITYLRQFDIIVLYSSCSRSALSMIGFYLNCCMRNFKPLF